jgi:hypothetical protein
MPLQTIWPPRLCQGAVWPATPVNLRSVRAFGLYQIGGNLVLERGEVQSECTQAIQNHYEDLPMNNFKETIGYITAKICDLESAERATNPPQDIPLSFYFTIEPEGDEFDRIRVLAALVDMGCIPVALLWRDLRSGKVSLGFPGSIPAWLHTVVSNRAPELINDVVSRLAGDDTGDSSK